MGLRLETSGLRGGGRVDLAECRCPVLLSVVYAPGLQPNSHLQIYDKTGTEWRVSFPCNLLVILCLLNLVFVMSVYSLFKQFIFILFRFFSGMVWGSHPRSRRDCGLYPKATERF